MTWLAWRQLRASLVVATVATAAVVGVLLATRGHVAAVAGTDRLSTFDDSLRLLGTALVGVPVLVGAFWGAPLVAHELEAGTHRLAWTQSTTRRRWLVTKVAVAAVAAVVLTGLFSLVLTWWSAPFDALGNRIGTADFGQRGIAPVSYALFALVLGTLAGAVLRRTLPAMAATAAGFFVVRFAFQLAVRPHLLSPITRTQPSDVVGQPAGGPAGEGGWVLARTTVDGVGHVIAPDRLDATLAGRCGLTRASTGAEWASCAERLGVHDIVRVHPAGHFWPLQVAESVAFLVLAAVLAVACDWWIHHRTA